MNNEEIRDQFAPLLDGELPPDERAVVEAALAQDAELLRELDSLKRVDDLFRGLPRVSAPENFERGVHDRLHPKTVSLARQFTRRRMWPALTAAALFLMLAGAVIIQMRQNVTRFELASVKSPATSPAPAPSVTANRSREGKGDALAESNAKREEARSLTDGVAQAEMPAEQAPAPQAAAESDQIAPNKLAPLEMSAEGAALAQPAAAPASPAPVSATNELLSAGSLNAPQKMEKSKREVGPADADADTAVAAGGAAESTAQMQSVGATAPAREDSKEQDVKDMAAKPSPVDESMPRAEMPALRGVADTGSTAMARPAPAPPAATPPAPASVDTPAAGIVTRAAARIAKSADTRSVAHRNFELRDGEWYETGYANESIKALKRGAADTRSLLTKDSGLDELLKFEEPVVFKAQDKWYRLEKPE